MTDGTFDEDRAGRIVDGTSQEDRIGPAQEDRFQVDELRFEDLLVLATDHARLLKYYELDDIPNGDWAPFLIGDETIVIAEILATNLDQAAIEFARFLPRMSLSSALPWSDNDLTQLPNYRFAQQLNDWMVRLRTIESKASTQLSATIHSHLQDRLKEALQTLGSFLCQYDPTLANTLVSGFDRDWFLDLNEPLFQDQVPLRTVDPSAIDIFLKANFHSFFNAVAILKKQAADLLPSSLHSRDHDPAVALYLAFAKLYGKMQTAINGFTTKHLSFYYDDILQIRPRNSIADRAYLTLEPDAEGHVAHIPSGTEFLAGLDDHDEEIIYTATSPLAVHSTQVEALHTLYFAQDTMEMPERELLQPRSKSQFYTAAKADQIPVETVETPDGERSSWSLFGTGDNYAARAPDAELGFAVASPVLLLKEGQRNITFCLEFETDAAAELNTYLQRLVEIEKTSDSAAFFKVFRGIFTIELTTDEGWIEVEEYRPVGHLVEPDYDANSLYIETWLSRETAPITPYVAEIHGTGYETGLPLARFTVNPAAYLYPYSLLHDLTLRSIEIKVQVTGVRDVLIYNNIGQLDSNNSFNPFGPIPTAGSYLIVGSPEAAQKHLTSFDLDIEWGDLPTVHGGLETHYLAYETPYNESIFAARLSALRDGQWSPYSESDQPKVPLFPSADDEPTNKRNKRCRLSLDHGIVRSLRPTRSTGDQFGYDTRTKDGFLKLTLTDPEYAFGHKAYPTLLTKIMLVNAKTKRPRNFVPIPNPPYTPLINSISLQYTASATIDFGQNETTDAGPFLDRFFHVHPFGLERIVATSHLPTYLLPQYDAPGNLFIGLSGSEAPREITLFFHLREDSIPSTLAELPTPSWSYLAANKWNQLTESDIITDTTDGFLTSGIVRLNLPADINLDHTVMKSGLYWIRASADRYLSAVCSLYSIRTQALEVELQLKGNSPAHLASGLPFGTIGEPKIAIPRLGSIDQPLTSFGGRPAESGSTLRMRISERLKHKNRATDPWDYERLILEQFPEVFKVKCFPHTDDQVKPHERIRPGQVLIVVIPRPQEQILLHLQPMANAYLLRRIEEFVSNLASPFAKIKVRNPVYEQIQIRCTVQFDARSNDGYFINVLNQALIDYLSPWSGTGYGAQFGWRINRYEVESHIRSLEYVEYVTNFSMLHIVDKGDGKYLLFDTAVAREDGDATRSEDIGPVYPWSIAVPMRVHAIETMDTVQSIAPKITGVGELEIGRTFIIYRK